jgi:hypothetical protein
MPVLDIVTRVCSSQILREELQTCPVNMVAQLIKENPETVFIGLSKVAL